MTYTWRSASYAATRVPRSSSTLSSLAVSETDTVSAWLSSGSAKWRQGCGEKACWESGALRSGAKHACGGGKGEGWPLFNHQTGG
eukprot:363519-Chlamydomonas_euryale.AAC.8